MKFIKFLFFTLILFNIPSYANENLINERIEFFKNSDKSVSNIKKLIKLKDYDAIVKEGKFIYEWSKSIPLYFPEGTQASMENGSDASYEIWMNFTDFSNKAKITEIASFELMQSASEKT
jgi:cytochrome c556